MYIHPNVICRAGWNALSSRFRRVAQSMLSLIDRYQNVVVLGGVILALATLAATTVTLGSSRESRITLEETRATGVASSLANSIGANLRIYDALLLDMVSEAENPQTSRLPENIRERLKFGKAVSAEVLDDAYIVDADGQITASLEGTAGPGILLDDRDYFLAQKDSGSPSLCVSRPLRSRAPGGKMSVVLSRRIEGKHHEFAGVALIVVNLEKFQRFVDAFPADDVDAVSVVRDDGAVLAHAESRGNGSDVQNGISHMSREPVLVPGWRSDAVQIPGSSLFVVAVPSIRGALEQWNREALTAGLLALAFATMLVVGSLLLETALVERKVAMEQLRDLSVKDGLTGLSNRRALDVKLAEEWQRCRRTGEDLSVLFVDIDRFKLFNDEYGHATGDEVLRLVASRVSAHARRGQDMAARYGGEEFAVVLPNTDSNGACQIAEDIRRDIENLQIAHVLSEKRSVTVSIGCATAAATARTDAFSVLEAADAQLHIAKADGRNRVQSIVLTAAAAQSAACH